MSDNVLIIDIGEKSGTHTIFSSENGVETSRTVYRFDNSEQMFCGHRIWDIDGIYEKIRAGITAAFEECPEIGEIRLKTWKYDYVLMCGDVELLPCYSHRDARVREVSEVETKGDEGTVSQLMVDLCHGRLRSGADILMMSEYFAYRLTGEKIAKSGRHGKMPVRGMLKSGLVPGAHCSVVAEACVAL